MERILLKISGACLKTDNSSIIKKEKIQQIAEQISYLSDKYVISIVIGGGNIWRGNYNKDLQLNQNLADNMGMLATLINSLALENVLKTMKINAKTFSAFDNELCEKYNVDKVNEFLQNKKTVAILAGGTGNSFFSTDTAAALRACQLNIKKIYMGKNGVDGVYSDDPKTVKNAKHYKQLSYMEVVNNKLKVMDLTALTICEENKIELFVFDIDEKDSLSKVVNGEKINFTKIS